MLGFGLFSNFFSGSFFVLFRRIFCWIWGPLSGLLGVLAIITWFVPGVTFGPMGKWLIEEDPLVKAEAIFVLGGKPYERAKEGAKIFHQKYAPRIYTTGELVPSDVKALGLNIPEAQITKQALIREKVPLFKIKPIKEGTSTFEEFEIIYRICKEKNYHSVIVVTTKFHTKRVQMLKEHFREENSYPLQIIVHGASAEEYKEKKWWKYEAGLIFWFEELMKIIYYEFKYF